MIDYCDFGSCIMVTIKTSDANCTVLMPLAMFCFTQVLIIKDSIAHYLINAGSEPGTLGGCEVGEIVYTTPWYGLHLN